MCWMRARTDASGQVFIQYRAIDHSSVGGLFLRAGITQINKLTAGGSKPLDTLLLSENIPSPSHVRHPPPDYPPPPSVLYQLCSYEEPLRLFGSCGILETQCDFH